MVTLETRSLCPPRQLLLFFGCITVMFGGLYLLIPNITIVPPQSSTTQTSNAQPDNSELELCTPATIDCVTAKTSIHHNQEQPKTSVVAVVAKASRRQARARMPNELTGITPRLAEGPEDDRANWLWKTPSGNDFFRVAHSVSFANTGSFDKTRTASNASAAVGMPDSAQGRPSSIYDGAGAGLELPRFKSLTVGATPPKSPGAGRPKSAVRSSRAEPGEESGGGGGESEGEDEDEGEGDEHQPDRHTSPWPGLPLPP